MVFEIVFWSAVILASGWGFYRVFGNKAKSVDAVAEQVVTEVKEEVKEETVEPVKEEVAPVVATVEEVPAVVETVVAKPKKPRAKKAPAAK
jgi:hypothetical protein